MSSFVIVTTGDLPEAYFLARFLESRAQRLAMVNVVARPVADQLRVLARLRRNRGNAYVADLLLARAEHWLRSRVRRPHGQGAFPEVDAAFMRHIRLDHPHLDCTDPHAEPVLDFVRRAEPDYLLLAGAQIIRPVRYQLHGRARSIDISDCSPSFAAPIARSGPLRCSDRIARATRSTGSSRRWTRARSSFASPSRFATSLPWGLSAPLAARSLRGIHRRDRSDLAGRSLPPVPQNGGGRYFPPAPWSTRRKAEHAYDELIARPLP